MNIKYAENTKNFVLNFLLLNCDKIAVYLNFLLINCDKIIVYLNFLLFLFIFSANQFSKYNSLIWFEI